MDPYGIFLWKFYDIQRNAYQIWCILPKIEYITMLFSYRNSDDDHQLRPSKGATTSEPHFVVHTSKVANVTISWAMTSPGHRFVFRDAFHGSFFKMWQALMSFPFYCQSFSRIFGRIRSYVCDAHANRAGGSSAVWRFSIWFFFEFFFKYTLTL